MLFHNYIDFVIVFELVMEPTTKSKLAKKWRRVILKFQLLLQSATSRYKQKLMKLCTARLCTRRQSLSIFLLWWNTYFVLRSICYQLLKFCYSFLCNSTPQVYRFKFQIYQSIFSSGIHTILSFLILREIYSSLHVIL